MKRGIDYIGAGMGAIIVNEEGRVFLARRGPKAKNEQGLWEFPGGFVEFGETLAKGDGGRIWDQNIGWRVGRSR